VIGEWWLGQTDEDSLVPVWRFSRRQNSIRHDDTTALAGPSVR